jgi:hypothetical protein
MRKRLLLSLIASLLGFLSAGSLSNAQSPDQVKYDSSAPSITCLYGYSANSYGSCSKNYSYTPQTIAPYKAPSYSYTPRTIAPYKAPTFNYTPRTIAPYKAPTFNYTPQTVAPYKAPSYSMNSPSAICRDGTYSYSQNRSGTCSWHGGVSSWLG